MQVSCRRGSFFSTPQILLTTFGLAGVLLLTSCSRSDAPAAAATPATGATGSTGAPAGRGAGRGGGGAMVTTAVVAERAIPVNVRGVGNVEATSTVEVHSQVTGELVTVEFQEGQDVKAGDLLFTIDPRPLEVALRQAQAVLAKDIGQSKTLEA